MKQIGLFSGKVERRRNTAGSTSGYAMKPGTGPSDRTCGDCKNCVQKKFKWRGKHTFKCGLVTDDKSRFTDIIKSSPACHFFVPVVVVQ